MEIQSDAIMPVPRFFLPLFLFLISAGTLVGCTQESQNRIGRSIQNWTGTDGVLEIYAGDTLVR